MPILPQNKGLRLSHLIGGLLTQSCLLCAATSEGGILCSACAAELPPLPGPGCPQCALPTPNGETCGRCLASRPYYDATFAAFQYAFPLDKLVQSFKYEHRLAVGQYFGERLASLMENVAADLIIPLPLHEERLRERGFNQALELARPVSKLRKIAINASICKRTRNTPAQANLPWAKRAKNIHGAFHCTEDLHGKRILLVDDVMTTGASVNECARTLKLHGAIEVSVMAIARALPT